MFFLHILLLHQHQSLLRASCRRSFLQLVSCLLTCLPPRSTLFPYTTLFRSGQDALNAAWNGVRLAPADAEAQDRKSTRLNSSHLVISYAVFCLKKKKQGASRASR